MAQGAPTATAMAQADLRSWVRAKVTELEGFEDQVVIDSVCRRLDDVQLDRAAFESHLHILMEGRAAPFSAQLWRYLDGPTGTGLKTRLSIKALSNSIMIEPFRKNVAYQIIEGFRRAKCCLDYSE